MKFLPRLMVVLLTTSLFVACSKGDKAPVFVMEGEWSGKLGDGNATPTSSLKWNIKPNGVIERVSANGSISATGTWTLAGNQFDANYTFPNSGGTATFEGTVDKSNNKLTGTWSNTGGEEGNFYVNKTIQ